MESTNRYRDIAVIVVLLVFSGCATSGGGFTPESNSSPNNSIEVADNSVTLAEYLQKVPGVQVRGSGPNATVTVRGQNSLSSGNASYSGTSSAPLFVIDGRTIGNDFAQAFQEVNMGDVASIKVLKGADAARYGSRGASGVIEINYEE